MTDTDDPNQLDPLDDIASAHLDGQTTAQEAAQVAADPALAARVATLAEIRAALQSEVTPVDDDRLESSIAAALAAFDDEVVGDPAPADPGPVTSITVAAARRRVSRRGVQVIGAVAIAVLLALAVPFFRALDSESSPDEVASTGEASVQGDGDGAERAEDDASAGAAADAQPPEALTTFGSPSVPVDLGSFEDLDALTAAAGAYPSLPLAATTEDRATPTTAAQRESSAGSCPEPPSSGTPVLTGTATLDGQPVQVFVSEDASGARTVVVVDPTDCTIISTRQVG